MGASLVMGRGVVILLIGLLVGLSVGQALGYRLGSSSWESRVSELERKLSDADVALSKTQPQLSEAYTVIKDLQNALSDALFKVSQLEGELSDTKSQVATLSEKLSEIRLQTTERNEAPPDVETVAERLEIPWSLAFSPEGRLFFTERSGGIYLIEKAGKPPSLLARLQVAHVEEAGLLGLTLDPGYPENRFLYAYYTYSEAGRLWNRVVRLIEKDGQALEDRVIIDRIPGAPIHDGGRVKFGPDGKLYVTTGDAGDPLLAQNLNSLAGKILRLNSDGSIPPDNPLPRSPVYSYGHRNPQGLAWEPSTGRLLATEHGPVGNDEVNIIQPGGNYGWPGVQGIAGRPGYIDPIAAYTPSIAPSGATFHSGKAYPTWGGRLFFATLRGQHLHFLELNGTSAVLEGRLLSGLYGRLRDAVEGPDGFLYIATSNRDGRGTPAGSDDRILRVVPPRR